MSSMLRNFLDYQLSLTKKGKPLEKLHPLVAAGDTFFYEAPINTSGAPHARDAVDLKRWMILVVIGLLPCIFMSIWNTGVQKLVYASGDYKLMLEYITASTSFQGYMDFVAKDSRWLTILQFGAAAFFPVMIISYAVGGIWEGIFAVIRKHDIAEGFLVSGILYPLTLPPTIPYWMVAVGVSVGIILGKEVFGGTGMNIVNPALTCRAFLFFGFPAKMSGDVWAGTNPTVTRESLAKMNVESGLPAVDGFTQATALAKLNISDDIRRVHVDAIASNNLGGDVASSEILTAKLTQFDGTAQLGQLGADQLQQFVTTPVNSGGLGLPPDQYQAAAEYAQLHYGMGMHSDANFFFGNMLGSMGETSTFACLLGALFLVWVGVGSWRTMLAVAIGALTTAGLFQLGANTLGLDGGIWNSARFSLPAYKHLIIGGLAFGLVFMATDPVSSPGTNLGKWLYGLLVGFVVIFIRLVNPAFPEGTFLAILLGNVFAPLIDHYCLQFYRRRAPRVQPA